MDPQESRNNFVAIIPAAGKGTRLGLPYPKELTPITYEGTKIITVIESNILQLSRAGITEAVIVISKEKQVIKEYLGEIQFGVHLRYVYQNRMHSREGLTDAVMSARAFIKPEDICIMLMGDVFFTDPNTVINLKERILSERSGIAVVSVWITFEPHRFGIVETNDDRTKAIKVIDKPEGLHTGLHWGAVAFRGGFWFYMDYETSTFSSALNSATKDGVYCVLGKYEYVDIGTPKSLIEAIVEVNK